MRTGASIHEEKASSQATARSPGGRIRIVESAAVRSVNQTICDSSALTDYESMLREDRKRRA